MKYIKIPHELAEDILSLYEPNKDFLALSEETSTPHELIKKGTEAGLYADVVTFIAHGLPVRESVWWACSCAMEREDWSQEEMDAVHAAKAWVHNPDESCRRYAEQTAKTATLDTGAGWAAQAAFWSGGSMTSPADPIVPPPPYLYAQAVAGCVNLCAVLPDGAEAKARYEKYLEIGTDIANGGNGNRGEAS